MLGKLATEIHTNNVKVGWWDNYPNKKDRHEVAMMLVVSEIAEAMEGHRKNLMDDHLPQFKMFDVELADALIRLLDLAGAYGIEEYTLDTLVEQEIRVYTSIWHELEVPEQLWRFVKTISRNDTPEQQVYYGIGAVLAIAELNEVFIYSILKAKVEYNLSRADHKRSNRAAEGGKQY